jgi:hypothetical protein
MGWATGAAAGREETTELRAGQRVNLYLLVLDKSGPELMYVQKALLHAKKVEACVTPHEFLLPRHRIVFAVGKLELPSSLPG